MATAVERHGRTHRLITFVRHVFRSIRNGRFFTNNTEKYFCSLFAHSDVYYRLNGKNDNVVLELLGMHRRACIFVVNRCIKFAFSEYAHLSPFEPRCEKTGLRGFGPGPTLARGLKCRI